MFPEAIPARAPADSENGPFSALRDPYKFAAVEREFRARREYDRKVDAREDARAFWAKANGFVDEIEADRVALGLPEQDVLAYLLRRHPRTAPSVPGSQDVSARFKREPDIVLPNVRFGRTRLFLSHFIGRVAWRMWAAL